MKKNLNKVKIVDEKINYTCLQSDCPCSCCGPFNGVKNGIESINNIEFHEIFLLDYDYKKIFSSGYSHLTTTHSKDIFKMKLREDGSCTALVDGKCIIHKYKPSICKAFPFYIDMFVGLCVVSATCSGVGAGWTKLQDIKQEINAAKEMYLHWVKIIEEYSNNL